MKKILLSLCAVLAVLVFYAPAMALHLEPTPGVTLDFYATNNCGEYSNISLIR